ncbi:hypothetical protein BOTBODRAFT_171005 [Botryobasidium botryosum FD-172 SS1]|uniref:Uncharacterized protein n=1 Tax=Botryobasidium botryosum (strain FD-172 SS1) TaxID=930990 RepID=A0A067N5I5_BOTB1|nr:hypothetical protein BOTBODRAFT_171005 [Botryobasidium botryosum FD-172 SS1]
MSSSGLTTITTPTLIDRLREITDGPADVIEYYRANGRPDEFVDLLEIARDEEKWNSHPGNIIREAFRITLEEIYELARQAAAVDSGLTPQELHSFLKRASDFENKLLDCTYTVDDDFWSFTSPYCGNLVEDTEYGLSSFYALLGKTPSPFDPASKPSPYTSTLARFRENRPVIPDSTPDTLRALLEARCEVDAIRIDAPTAMACSEFALALVGGRGYNNRESRLGVLYNIEERGEWAYTLGYMRTPGLGDVPSTAVLDDARRLVFIADSSRIKSFQWDGNVTDHDLIDLLPVHTMNSGGDGGPLALLHGGAKLLRASKGKLMVWDVDSAPTHGKTGKKIVGEKPKAGGWGVWRDGTDKIELSGGSEPTQTISLGDEFWGGVKAWAQHPSQPSSMISGLSGQYRCVQLDVETGQIATFWIGNRAYLTSIHTSPADPWSFVTACSEGVTRLYDVRQPVPVLAVYSAAREAIRSSLLVHVDGQPYIFTGGTKLQQIRCWDVRARLPLYELATGNNQVTALAWDALHCTLYAQTHCEFHVSEFSGHQGYREFRGPGRVSDDERCWPAAAFHDEQAFEHPLDRGCHSLFRYVFKTEPDASQVPRYGYATCSPA